jgi:hypothetical protein
MEKKMNDKMEKQRVESEKQRIEIESLRSNMAQLKDDNTQLKLDNARLLTDLSEVHDDLRILHPLPYARLHLQHCIERQEACNAELNVFHHRYLTDTIISNPVLTLRER